MKKLKILIVLASFLILTSCGGSNNSETDEQTETVSAEVQTIEEDEKVEIKLDAENKEVGIETDEINIELKGDNSEKEEQAEEQ